MFLIKRKKKLEPMKHKHDYKPYISSSKNIPEFTFKAIFLGVLFGFIFAIANAYLGLKIGTTISASIPAAIMSMAIMRLFFKKASILENNIVQTIATVGEALAAGVIFTVPALIFLGDTPSISKIFVLTLLGGILGILFMIPMRRYIIVDEHKTLPFPEGTACAEILKAGESSKSSAITALWGFLIGASYKVLTNIFFIFEEVPKWIIVPFKKTEFSIDATPALLGVGYIIGYRISSLMFVGGIFGWFIILPLIKVFGESSLIIYPSEIAINAMSAEDIWSHYIRYIGAGMVAVGGFIGLFKIIPLLWKTVHVGTKELFATFKEQRKVDRIDKDISLSWVLLGSIAIILTLWLLPITSLNLFTVVLLVLLGFLFVAVTSITVGIVGSTSNPVSGMTLVTLLITCVLFVILGWTEKIYLMMAISMSCVANVAICMAATTSQDLKTGFLLGATPKHQQVAEIIGVIVPALALGSTVYLLNKAYTLGSPSMPAPQAALMAMIAKGVIAGQLPFVLVGIGAVLGLTFWLIKIPILPFAIGLYLPLSLSAGTMVGGILALILSKTNNTDEAKSKGMLIASGLIGGDACLGILIALLAITGVISPDTAALLPSYASVIMFALLCLLFALFTHPRKK